MSIAYIRLERSKSRLNEYSKFLNFARAQFTSVVMIDLKRWEDNIEECTGLEWNIILWKAENREEWRKLVVKLTVMPQRSARLRDR